MDDLFMSFGVFFVALFLFPFGMYVWLNDKFAYDKKIENVFGRCRLMKYLLPFISTLILSFLIVVFAKLIAFYDEGLEGLVSRIKYPSLRFFFA